MELPCATWWKERAIGLQGAAVRQLRPRLGCTFLSTSRGGATEAQCRSCRMIGPSTQRPRLDCRRTRPSNSTQPIPPRGAPPNLSVTLMISSEPRCSSTLAAASAEALRKKKLSTPNARRKCSWIAILCGDAIAPIDHIRQQSTLNLRNQPPDNIRLQVERPGYLGTLRKNLLIWTCTQGGPRPKAAGTRYRNWQGSPLLRHSHLYIYYYYCPRVRSVLQSWRPVRTTME